MRAGPEPLFERAELTAKERRSRCCSRARAVQIAALEHNSPKTIREHISSIYGKCAVNSRAEFFCMIYEQQAAI